MAGSTETLGIVRHLIALAVGGVIGWIANGISVRLTTPIRVDPSELLETFPSLSGATTWRPIAERPASELEGMAVVKHGFWRREIHTRRESSDRDLTLMWRPCDPQSGAF